MAALTPTGSMQRAGWDGALGGELGEVFGHGPAEGHDGVAPLGGAVGEEGRHLGRDRVGLEALVIEPLGQRAAAQREERAIVVGRQVDAEALGQAPARSEEHTSELWSLMRNSYPVFCLKTN